MALITNTTAYPLVTSITSADRFLVLSNTGTTLAQIPQSDVTFATAVNTGQMVYVDAVNGDNATGTRGRLELPFLTLVAALSAAQSGDTIYVYPGTYALAASLTGKDGVNWFFYPGVTIQLAAGVSLLKVDDPMTFLVRGNGAQVTTATTTISAFICDNAAATVEIDDLSITTAANASNGAVDCGDGNFILRRCVLSSLSAAGTVQFFPTDPASTMLLDSCRVVNNADGITVAGAGLTIQGGVIVAGSATNSINSASGAQNVKVYGTTVTNKAKNSNITIQVGTLTVDSNVS